jgi:hypothetical protein
MKPFQGKAGDRVCDPDSGAVGTAISVEMEDHDAWLATIKWDNDLGEVCVQAADVSWPHDCLIKEFEQEDWYGFSGAETWPSGAQPMIGYGLNWIGVADPHGVELYKIQHNAISSEPEPTIRIEMQVPNQHIARLLLAGFPNELDWKTERQIDYSHNEFV